MAGFRDTRDEVGERARRAGMKVEIIEATGYDATLRIYFPNGGTSYPLTITSFRADVLTEYNFEHWIILGDYLAIYDRSRGLIKVSITHLMGSAQTQRSIVDLPGVSWGPVRIPGLFDDSEGSVDFKEALADLGSREALVNDRPWSLSLRRADEVVVAKFSNCSLELLALDSLSSVSDECWKLELEIISQERQGHDEALKFLEQVSSALFFEMDLRYNMKLALVQRRTEIPRFPPPVVKRAASETWKAPQMPRVRYQHDAVSLYLHGRSSVHLPLSRFLAYYQAIEYHFPMFVERSLLTRLRNKLRDPGFNPDNSAHLHQLVRLMGNVRGGTYPREQEQLAITLSECTDEADLIEFLKGDKLRWKVICDKKTIEGVHVLSEKDRNFPLVKQVAKRIHQIRCRIVHAKEDGGPEATPMLLPTSPEVRNLRYDIDVVQYLAQKVIIAGAES